MKIFGICGFIGSGKDTISNIFIKEGYVKLSFASILKDVISVIFGWERKMIEGDTLESRNFRDTIDQWWANKLKINEFTPRLALQLIGTELFREHFNDAIWLFALENQIGKYDRVIISDCRFKNEIDMIKRLGGKIIHITREQQILPPYHSSEYEWLLDGRFDYEVKNDTTIEELEIKVLHLIRSVE